MDKKILKNKDEQNVSKGVGKKDLCKRNVYEFEIFEAKFGVLVTVMAVIDITSDGVL